LKWNRLRRRERIWQVELTHAMSTRCL
jgi:hypothetical protein